MNARQPVLYAWCIWKARYCSISPTKLAYHSILTSKRPDVGLVTLKPFSAPLVLELRTRNIVPRNSTIEQTYEEGILSFVIKCGRGVLYNGIFKYSGV